MNDNLCDVTVVLDRSGSMASVKEGTIGGFNLFLSEQKKAPGKCNMTLVQFDDHRDFPRSEKVYEALDAAQTPNLTEETYLPRGGTPLLDAIGSTIVATGQRLASMPEADRPGKVVFVIVTDGEENASREYTRERILEMIKHQTDTFKWVFVFLGANQDAIASGRGIGVQNSNSMTYAHSNVGTRSAFAATASNLASYRGSGQVEAMCYSDAQREEAIEDSKLKKPKKKA